MSVIGQAQVAVQQSQEREGPPQHTRLNPPYEGHRHRSPDGQLWSPPAGKEVSECQYHRTPGSTSFIFGSAEPSNPDADAPTRHALFRKAGLSKFGIKLYESVEFLILGEAFVRAHHFFKHHHIRVQRDVVERNIDVRDELCREVRGRKITMLTKTFLATKRSKHTS